MIHTSTRLMDAVSNSKFTWGDNDATFVALDRFIDKFPECDSVLAGAIVAPPSADIFVLLEE